SFALTASYELLTRQVRRGAFREDRHDKDDRHNEKTQQQRKATVVNQASPERLAVVQSSPPQEAAARGDALQRQAWQWALARQAEEGVLPSGRTITSVYGRHERWAGSSRMLARLVPLVMRMRLPAGRLARGPGPPDQGRGVKALIGIELSPLTP